MITVYFDGEEIEVDVDKELSGLDERSELTRSRVAAQEAWWSAVSAAAERDVEILTAELDSFSAVAKIRLLESDPKISEWKAKAAVAAQEKVKERAIDIASARENARLALGILNAWRRKADMLRSEVPLEVARWHHSNSIGKNEQIARSRQKIKDARRG